MRLRGVYCFIISCCFFYGGGLQAASWYQVEVIIFEHLEADDAGELWFENPGLPQRHDSIQLILDKENDILPEAANTLMPYLALDKGYYRLDGIQRGLRFSKAYRPLLHIAWQQPGLGKRSTRSVHLENTLFEKVNTPKPGNHLQQENDVIYERPKIIYDGIVRLRSSHLLHVDIDFSFFPEDFIEKQKAVAARNKNAKLFHAQYADYVRLIETRRIKINEIHYFDHPIFGMILQVSRLRKPNNQASDALGN